MTEINYSPLSSLNYVQKVPSKDSQENKKCNCEHCTCSHNADTSPSACYGRDLVHKINIIKAGDAIFDNAFNAETKPGKATFTLAKGDEEFPNIWDENGGKYTPNKGDIILGYGEVPREWGIANPDVLEEMNEKGLETYPDKAVSSEPELMYETYLGEDGRDFQEFPLEEGETVDAEKKIFPAKFLFATPGTLVETLEAREGAGSLANVGDFQYIQLDINGNPYVKDIKDLIKRLNPADEESKEVFEKIKDVISVRDEILKDENIGQESKKEILSNLWNECLKQNNLVK